jgi:uncharacterized membrane protein
MKKYLITGLLILVPLAITFWVLHLVVATMDQVINLFPENMRNHPPLNIPGVGVILTIAFVLVVGVLAHNLLGRTLLKWWESILGRIPIVRSIYSSVKQVSDTILSPQGQAFRKTVLVEFPRPGAWSIGFLVGSPGPEIESKLGAVQTVFVPTAPNPTSGYTIILDQEQMLDLDMTVDEGLKYIISLGVVVPGARSQVAGLGPNTRFADDNPNE